MHSLLQKAACAEDVEYDLHPRLNQDHCLPFPPAPTEEIHKSLFKSKNSTPGCDEITTPVIKKAWPILGPAITTLFQCCLQTGWHPTPFRSATLVAIPKPGKRDQSNPRAYRLIALLSALGKGLERLIARCMSWIAIKHKVLHPQQFGALPLCSSTDLTAAVVHDIELAWSQGRKASMLTLDVQVAFDAVLPGQLIQRLHDQSWPIEVIRWVASFTQNRSANLRMGDHTSQVYNTPAGVPQGSPVSPILFMLFTEPVFKLGSPQLQRG